MTMRIMPANWIDECDDLAVSPSAVSTLPITNLQNTAREDVWRSPNLDPQTITGTFGGNARPINSFGIWPGLGAASLIGAKVRLVLSCAGSSVYDSGTLDFFTFSGEGWGLFEWGGHPWGVEEGDRTALLAPLVKFFTEIVADAFTLTITNGGAVDTPYFEARRFWLAQSILAPYTANVGLAPAWVDTSESQRSPGGSKRIRDRAKFRRLQFDTVFDTEADRADWSDLQYLAGTSREVVISLVPGEGTRRERDLTACGFFEILNPIAFTDYNFHTLQLAIEES